MIIKASELKAGSQAAEANGFLFDVVEIVQGTPKTITVRLCSDFSSIHNHWTIKPDGASDNLFVALSLIYSILPTQK
ncbi:MAG: hypothetical protein NC337_14835 [Roseburia sp.]|nr:hypothetical protein [Roseburia sp.]